MLLLQIFIRNNFRTTNLYKKKKNTMHHSNAEWYWNSATNNHLALPAPDALSMHRASTLSSNAIITDVGICVGMSNVNLNAESAALINSVPHCCKYSIPRPLIPPNWYKTYAKCIFRDETFAKYHQTPVFVSNGLNALVVNEYSAANMRDEVIKLRQSQITHSISAAGDLKFIGEPDSDPVTSKSLTLVREDPLIAPPKKKWIRHYMMGE